MEREELRKRNRLATKRYRSKPGFKEKYKDGYLRRTYGITLNQYKEMSKKQNGCCYICDRHESLFNKSLYVDHDHSTGKVRKLLCSNCNTAVGAVKEKTELCYAIAYYLLSHPKNGVNHESKR